MKLSVKLLSIASAVLLLAACETAPGANGGAGGAGNGAGGNGANVTPGGQDDLSNNVGDRVFFDYDSSVINADGEAALQRQAQWLKQYSNINVVVEGHCDERGTREYNLALGERRAAAAKKYLVGLGVDAGRVSTISYGKERPAVVGSTEEAWSQNRRAVTVVTGK